MSLNFVLDQVLKIAKSTGNELGRKAASAHGGQNPLTQMNPLNPLGSLTSLFGKKQPSTGGSTLAKVGSIAALGALAYQAYKMYSDNQNTTAPAQSNFSHEHKGDLEASSHAILRAMIAAAASDGEIDPQERALIINEVADPQDQQWLQQEMSRPATPADIAREVGNNPALAAEVYLAARMVCGDLARKEIVFLAQLSEALNLDEKLVDSLEKQVGLLPQN